MLVSIIIPIRNEEAFVDKCLDSLCKQIKNRDDIEVLCVDGNSTDMTRERILEYSRQYDMIKLLENPNKIAPVAMNIGLKQAKGKYVMIMGCHAEYSPNYVEACLEVIERTGADQVGGYMETIPGRDTSVGRSIAAATSCRFGVGNASFRLTGPEKEVDTVPFGMYRKEVFEKIGGYDERLVRNQDIELNRRLLAAGGKTIISPEIKLRYFNKADYPGLFRQAFGNGQWGPYTVWLTGGGLSLRHYMPMCFFTVLAILAWGWIFCPYSGIILAAAVSVYLASSILYAFDVSKTKHVSAIQTFFAFLVLHFAYGLGSAWGVITVLPRFPNRGTRTSQDHTNEINQS